MSSQRDRSTLCGRRAALMQCTVTALVVLSFASFSSILPAAHAQTAAQPQLDLRLPLKAKSVRFAVIGDSGTGDKHQYEVAQQMEAYHRAIGFDFVIMLGDNIYGGHGTKDFATK